MTTIFVMRNTLFFICLGPMDAYFYNQYKTDTLWICDPTSKFRLRGISEQRVLGPDIEILPFA